MDDVLEYSDGGKTVIDVKDKSVKTIVIPKGVTKFGGNAFEDCSSLESIDIPDGVTKIGTYAFDY